MDKKNKFIHNERLPKIKTEEMAIDIKKYKLQIYHETLRELKQTGRKKLK